MNSVSVRINKSGDTSTWDKGDVLQLMKEFGIEAYGKSGNYYGYVYSYIPSDYDKIDDILSVNWHSSRHAYGDFIIYFICKGRPESDYMYIPEMDIRMRDLLIRKVIAWI